jgi:hypothetical protein
VNRNRLQENENYFDVTIYIWGCQMMHCFHVEKFINFINGLMNMLDFLGISFDVGALFLKICVKN